MGWLWSSEDVPELEGLNVGLRSHEGYAVAFVPREWWPRKRKDGKVSPSGRAIVRVPRHACGTDRQLGFQRDEAFEVRGIRWVAAECDCGWRSDRYDVGTHVTWDGIVNLPPHLETWMLGRWREHIQLEADRLIRLYRRTPPASSAAR
jgi:hypothetical protein